MSETWKRASGWTEDGDDGLPNFGRKARAWFARKVRANLNEIGGKYPYNMTDDEVEPVVARFAADPMPYVEWVDGEEYRGRGWSSGAWQIDWKALHTALVDVLEELRLEMDTASILSLDDWLKADLDDAFHYEGPAGGSEKLPKRLRRELLAAARDRRRKLPKTCTSCREPYQPTSNRQRRCPKCIDAEMTGKGSVRKTPKR